MANPGWASDETFKVLKAWGVSKYSTLFAILAPRTPAEVQADLETMVAYYGMVQRVRDGENVCQPGSLALFDEGLKFLVSVGTVNADADPR